MIPATQSATQPHPDEWLGSFVPLGKVEGESWTPIGAGVLFVEAPIVWLLTARSALEAAGDAPISAWVRDDKKGTLLDLTQGRRGTPLDWIVSKDDDVAVCLFPTDPSWKVKAFNESQCFPAHDLQALLPTATLCAPYGLAPLSGWTMPLVQTGTMASVDRETGQLVTTAPLLPRNAGAPLLITLPTQSGGGVQLAGILSHTVAVPEPHRSTAPPVRLAIGQPVLAALALIRGEQGKEQRKLALQSAGQA
ncbi:MAG TPA: hypothetical protein DEA08_07400 [Planctomycetes bacterium]|nr:hypothetical protein [Planctomycetota bacterium]